MVKPLDHFDVDWDLKNIKMSNLNKVLNAFLSFLSSLGFMTLELQKSLEKLIPQHWRLSKNDF